MHGVWGSPVAQSPKDQLPCATNQGSPSEFGQAQLGLVQIGRCTPWAGLKKGSKRLCASTV